MKTNVLLIGSGGREHALAWGLKQSPGVGDVFCASGNAGIEALAPCVPLDLKDRKALQSFIKEKKITLAVIGPEGPLVDGLADDLRAWGLLVFGPGKSAARLEGSKAFAKDFMVRHGIPTADFRVFTRAEEALAFVKSPQWPESLRVVKAAGLAAGKGVTVCAGRAEVLAALEAAMVEKVFGAAGDEVVLEEALEGEELSVIALCDGETLLPLSPSQDHKRVFDDDRGPNTGGMGAYAPVPRATEALWAEIRKKISGPFLAGLKKDNLPYRGVIYFGLMLTASGAKVLEFNVRFGDPETQVVVPLVETPWLELLLATAEGRLKDVTLKIKKGAALCVVLASGGYPGAFEKGRVISGLEKIEGQMDLMVFHSGTVRRNPGGPLVTAGGRVLAVTALGPDLESARRRAYEALGAVRFEGAHFRRDIGGKALKIKVAAGGENG